MVSCVFPLPQMFAQTTDQPGPRVTPSQSPSPVATASDEVVTLDVFSVSAKTASEYVAAESITGTRVASKIRDLPFTVNVITADFLEDQAAIEFREQTAYTSSVVGFESISTGYSVRGIDANVQLRNGFRRIGLIDKVNVERIEVIKGAAASIYGTVLPGGTVNVISKKPHTKPEHRIGFTVGSNSLLRGQASSTGPAGTSGKFFYRVDAAADTTEYDLIYKDKKQQTAVVSMLWKPKPLTSVLVEYEYLNREEHGNANMPFKRVVVADPFRLPLPTTGAARTYNSFAGIATELFDFNHQGPEHSADRYVHTVTVTLEHKINNLLSLRSSANWFERGLERLEVGGRDSWTPGTTTVPKGTARIRPFPEGGGAWQTDLLASWNTGSISHKTLLTFDYQRQTEKPEQWNSTTAFPAAVNAANAISILDPIYDFITFYEDPSTYTQSQKEDNSLDIYGIFLSERATILNERATVLAGVRYDYVDNHARDLRVGDQSESTTDEVSYQFGVNARILPALSAYTNISRSFVPQFSVGRNLDGTTFDVPNEIGESWEVGLKASAFDSKLTFTAAYYDITRQNIQRDVTDPTTGVLYTTVSGEERSTGYELDFNWVATSNLQFYGGWGKIDSEITSNETLPNVVGGPTRRTPDQTLGAGARYSFRDGRFKGLSFSVGYKYNGRSRPVPTGGRTITAAYNANQSSTAYNPIINVPMANGRLPFPDRPVNDIIGDTPNENGLRAVVDDGRESIWNDSYELVDASISYRWKMGRRYGHKLQLNVSNLLDERYTYGSAGQGPARAFIGTYEFAF